MGSAGKLGTEQYCERLAKEVARDLPIYMVMLAYAAVVAFAAMLLGKPDKLVPFVYVMKWLALVLAGVFLYVANAGFRSLRSPSPAAALRRRVADGLGPARIAGFALFFWLAVFHGVFTSLKTMMPDVATFSFDIPLANLDAALHGGDAWRLIPLWKPATVFMQLLYAPVWSALLGIMSFYAIVFASPDIRSRYVWTFLVCWIILGNLLALLFLSAGPAFYQYVTGSARFESLMSYLNTTQDIPFSSVHLQTGLWNRYTSGGTSLGSGISAFPSLHIAMVTLWALTAWKIRPWLGLLLTLYAILILIGSVHLGWHYAIDGYFAAVVVIIVWKIVGATRTSGVLRVAASAA